MSLLRNQTGKNDELEHSSRCLDAAEDSIRPTNLKRGGTSHTVVIGLEEFFEVIEGESIVLAEIQLHATVVVDECRESIASLELNSRCFRLHEINDVRVGEIQRVFHENRALHVT